MTTLNGKKDRTNFQCVYCGGEWSSKLQLFKHSSIGCPCGPVDPRTNKPISILVFPNSANAQLLKELKWQIQNNDTSFIQLKLGTQVEVEAETTLEEALINGEHIHVQVCRFKSLKGLLLEPHYNRQCQKGASKNPKTKDGKIKRGPLLKMQLASTSSNHILDVPQEQPNYQESKLISSSDQNTSIMLVV